MSPTRLSGKVERSRLIRFLQKFSKSSFAKKDILFKKMYEFLDSDGESLTTCTSIYALIVENRFVKSEVGKSEV